MQRFQEEKMTKNPRAEGGGSRDRSASTRMKKHMMPLDVYDHIVTYAHANGHTLTGAYTLAVDRYSRLTDRPAPEKIGAGERQQWRMPAVPVETANTLARLADELDATEVAVVCAAILATLR